MEHTAHSSYLQLFCSKQTLKRVNIGMKYEKTSLFGMILVIVALLISIYFMCNTNALVPAGYDLAIHGIVISRTLMIAFTLYLVSKLGYFLLNKKD
ncbi:MULTISPECIES: hypothetical protein [Bacillus]|uniref:Uncharacterized protein n=1 Tax=Bacillus stercoris TaxID=2054641 RepID=A0ABU0V9G2_9BACI|nr:MULTISPECIES: hypothetical protein [Bacillus]MCM2581737.1 hypothetical protein [Bacillus stercoris]MDQ1853565.1 hypothetical protein [Bacillus stercoris]NLS39778.1 hypothetical protein [Bacillus subtilis]WGE37364.1 hypothetical protein QA442_13010 [Bacillus stercoris]